MVQRQETNARRDAKTKFFKCVFFKYGEKAELTQAMLEDTYDSLVPGNQEFKKLDRSKLKKYLITLRSGKFKGGEG